MDGSLIADTANAIASFANVAVTGLLGVLVYKFTKQDEAGRIERALQNDRDLRREDWARERKARLANPMVDTLAKIPADLLTVAAYIDKPVPFQTQLELIDRLGEMSGELTRGVMVIPDENIRMEAGTLAEAMNPTLFEIAIHLRNERMAMPSWTEEVKHHCKYLAEMTNAVYSQVVNWQDGEPRRAVQWNIGKPMRLSRAQYPSLGN